MGENVRLVVCWLSGALSIAAPVQAQPSLPPISRVILYPDSALIERTFKLETQQRKPTVVQVQFKTGTYADVAAFLNTARLVDDRGRPLTFQTMLAKDADKKTDTFTLTVDGNGANVARLLYSLTKSGWKPWRPAYRLSIVHNRPETNTGKLPASPRTHSSLQQLAVIENATDQDWLDVPIDVYSQKGGAIVLSLPKRRDSGIKKGATMTTQTAASKNAEVDDPEFRLVVTKKAIIDANEEAGDDEKRLRSVFPVRRLTVQQDWRARFGPEADVQVVEVEYLIGTSGKIVRIESPVLTITATDFKNALRMKSLTAAADDAVRVDWSKRQLTGVPVAKRSAGIYPDLELRDVTMTHYRVRNKRKRSVHLLIEHDPAIDSHQVTSVGHYPTTKEEVLLIDAAVDQSDSFRVVEREDKPTMFELALSAGSNLGDVVAYQKHISEFRNHLSEISGWMLSPSDQGRMFATRDLSRVLRDIDTEINRKGFDQPWKDYDMALSAFFQRLQNRQVRTSERQQLDAARAAMENAIKDFNGKLPP